MVKRNEIIVDIGVIVIADARAARVGFESVSLGDRTCVVRIPAKIVTEENRVHFGSLQLFRTRAEIRHELVPRQTFADPVFGRRTLRHAIVAQPRSIEPEAHMGHVRAAVFEGRVFTPDDERYLEARCDQKRNAEQRQVHGNRSRSGRFERPQHEAAFYVWINSVVDMIDAERHQVFEVLPADFGSARGSPGHGERTQPIFKTFDRLPSAVLPAADRNDAVVALGILLGMLHHRLERALALRPIGLALGRVRMAGIATSVRLDAKIGARIRQHAFGTPFQDENSSRNSLALTKLNRNLLRLFGRSRLPTNSEIRSRFTRSNTGLSASNSSRTELLPTS